MHAASGPLWVEPTIGEWSRRALWEQDSGVRSRAPQRAFRWLAGDSADAALALVMLAAGPIELRLPHERTAKKAAA
jgi:hypothetical protein